MEPYLSQSQWSAISDPIGALLRTSLFNIKEIEKNKKFLFRYEAGTKPLLLDIIGMLGQITDLDQMGVYLGTYEKTEFFDFIRYFLELDMKFKKIIEDYDGDFSKYLGKNNIDDLVYQTEFKDKLIDFLPIVRNALNATLINIVVPDYQKFSKNTLNVEMKSKEIDQLSRRANELVGNIALLPTKQQVASFSQLFGKESKNFRTASILWIIGVFLCLFAVVGVSLYYNEVATSEEFKKYNINQLIQFNLTRILTIAALFYGLAICNKNYKSSKHNQIVNKHRENALASFQAFVEVPTTDAATKNAVLLEATRTIYGAQQTGYVVTDSDDSPNKLIDLIQSVQPK